jgi:hypothetical protein
MSTAQGPLHQLFLGKRTADNLTYGPFDKGCADGLAVPAAFVEVRSELAVVPNATPN